MSKSSTTRFSDRVEDYIKYRPDYPDGTIDVLASQIGLTKSHVVADIGSGTGKSSEPFIQNGNKVFAVEPNREMREAAEAIFENSPNFSSIDGTAESTGLPDRSIDLVFCGQAFHWFDRSASKAEFNRILKEDGHLALAWNSRSLNSDFQRAYERVLFEHIEEYRFVNHRNIDDAEIEGFFSPKKLSLAALPNRQRFDLEGLKGRLKSSSYCPKSGLAADKVMRALEELFEEHQRGGRVDFEYETKIYWC